jgi:regulatory protein
MARRWPRRDNDSPPPPDTARLIALRLLGRRDYTTYELTRKLRDRGFDDDTVAQTVAALSQQGVLNDRRAADAHVRTASRVKSRGPARIRRELESRGVPAEDITAATSDLSDDQVRESIARLLQRKGVPQPVPLDARPKLFQHLLRRGFPARLISEALKYNPEFNDG